MIGALARPDVDTVLDHPSVRRRAHLAPEPGRSCPGTARALRGAERRAARRGSCRGPAGIAVAGHDQGARNKMLQKRLPAPSYPSDHEKAAKDAPPPPARERAKAGAGAGARLSAAAAPDKDNEQEKTERTFEGAKCG